MRQVLFADLFDDVGRHWREGRGAGFVDVGVLNGCIGIILMGFIGWYTMLLVVRSARIANPYENLSYPDIGFAAFGIPGRLAVWFSLTLMTFGVCCTFAEFLGEEIIYPSCLNSYIYKVPFLESLKIDLL